MGFPWVVYNELSERFDYLYLKKGYEEHLGRAWTLFQTASTSPAADEAAGAPRAAAGAAPAAARAQRAAAGAQRAAAGTTRAAVSKAAVGTAADEVAEAAKPSKATPGRGAKRTGDVDSARKDSAPKKAMTSLQQARSLKDKYNKVMTLCLETERKVRNQECWSWAFNDALFKPLTAAHAALDACVSNDPMIA
eukprot:4091330-Lingulodinium_polyedra.AAC.1